jgi:DNA-binding CsgD family transcriptional regulator
LTWTPLTRTEAKVVRLVSLGCANNEIAAILGIAESTADNHRTSAMKKMGVRSAGTLTRVALVLGFTSLDDKLTDEVLTAVENGGGGDVSRRLKNGGAPRCSPGSWQDRGVSPDLVPLRREAQKCDATWSSGRRFVGRC